MYHSSYQRLGSTSFRGSPRKSSPLRNKTGSTFYGSPSRYPLSPRASSPSLSYPSSSLQLAQERQRDSDLYQERMLSQLRGQVSALRSQIDSANHNHMIEIQQLREDNDRRLGLLEAEKEGELRMLRSRIDELQFSFNKQTAEKESLETTSKNAQNENLRLRNQLSSLNGEIEYMKAQISERNKRNELLEQDKNSLTQQHQVKVEGIEYEHRRSMNSIHETLLVKENNVRKLEAEVAALRRELNESREAASRELFTMEKRLASTQEMLEAQDHRLRMVTGRY